jgi:protein gp37
MGDWADSEAPNGDEKRALMWRIIRDTQDHLDWLLLTKRIGNVERMLPDDWGAGYPNVVMMATIVNQHEAERDLRKLFAIPAWRRGVSIGPMLGEVNLRRVKVPNMPAPQSDLQIINKVVECDYLSGTRFTDLRLEYKGGKLDWVIIEGESKQAQNKVRPFRLDHALQIIHDCQDKGVPVFVKQLGALPVDGAVVLDLQDWRHGASIHEWPKEFRIREFYRPA